MRFNKLIIFTNFLCNLTSFATSQDCNCKTTWEPTISPTTMYPTRSPTRSPTTMYPTRSPTRAPFVCEKPVDIGLILDRSGSIPGGGLIKEKKFSIDVLNSFRLGSEFAKFSIISFSSKVDGIVGFSDDRVNITTAINSILPPRGSTFTGGAIKYFTDNYASQMRNDIQVIVIITDGKPTRTGNDRDPIKYTIQQVIDLKGKYLKLNIITIGVGNFDKDFLMKISSVRNNKSLMYNINSFSNLSEIIKDLVEDICYDET